MSKGSWRRRSRIGKEEEDLRWKLAMGEIPMVTFVEAMQLLNLEKDSHETPNECETETIQ